MSNSSSEALECEMEFLIKEMCNNPHPEISPLIVVFFHQPANAMADCLLGVLFTWLIS